MEKIKIISNPYKKIVEFKTYDSFTMDWKDISETSPNSTLREVITDRVFLPFKIKEIINIIIKEYYLGKEAVSVVFAGTMDEYKHVEDICGDADVQGKIVLSRDESILENARFILDDTKELFEKVQPIIEKIVKDDEVIIKDLNKISDALDDIIPICVFGNYSAGKSTFINALIGEEVLPSGGDPVTAKIYKIERETQEDEAKITFSYKDELFQIVFQGESYRLLKGNPNSDLMIEVQEAIESVKANGMFSMVNVALDILNGFEKRDKTSVVISNVIEVSVPFSKEGILGQSYNKFVIFDTPGSNSASNTDHSEVLEQAMEGFSNGIPIWVTVYESIDSEDNASLCEKVLSIKALDKRFTMIVSNKADGSDLDEEEFTEEKTKEILEYSSVEKMYSGGIYFVSSIMGLGAKKQGAFSDKHYRKIFRSQSDMYSDPEDMDYMSLYRYNIMPEQIKTNAVKYSEDCSNLIYSNSGLLCIEMEMEYFASRYSAYNKCQMVYDFLDDIIDETDRRITGKVARREKLRKEIEEKLDAKEKQLIESIGADVKRTQIELDKQSRVSVSNYVKAHLNFDREASEFEKRDSDIRQQNSEESTLSIQEEMYSDSKSAMLSHLKSNGQALFKGNVFKQIKSLKDDLVSDVKDVRDSKENRDNVERDVNKATSDSMIRVVIKEYKHNILSAKDSLDQETKRYWQEKAQELKDRLITIITGSENLSVAKRKEIAEIIMNYKPLEFRDDADALFVKKNFLRGNMLGLRSRDAERLNIRKLTSKYNDKIRKSIFEIATKINDSCIESFNMWVDSLIGVIQENITEYNPELKEMKESIKEETETINELLDNQTTIKDSFESITKMMDWQELE